MSSVWKRFQRINKKAAKFQFTASFHELSLHLTPRWKPNSLEVVWQRRNRRVATPVPAWEPGMREPLEGVCVWTLPANTVVNVTLFRDNRTQRYEDKEWTFVLEDVSATGKRRQVATAQLNMTQYAGICQHDLRVTLRPLSKKLAAASLELTLSCLFLREGKATDEDMQSLASLMSMNCPNDIAPLDDFEDDEEDGPGSEAGSRVSTLRRRSRLAPYTGGPSPHGPSTLLQDGRCAEISDLAAQITSLTSSLQQQDGDDTRRLDADGGADQEGDNATLEGDVVKESSAFSPDPRSPQFATSPPQLGFSSQGLTSPAAGNTSTPITTTTSSSSRPQDSTTSGTSEFPSAHSLSMRLPSPDRTGAGVLQLAPDSPSEAGRFSTSSPPDWGESYNDGAGESVGGVGQPGDTGRRRTLEDRQALQPLDLAPTMVGRSGNTSGGGSTGSTLSGGLAAATPGQDLLSWCQAAVAGHRGVKITNMTTSWRSGLAFCAVIHAFRPDLIDYSRLSPQDVVGNCRAAFEAGERLGVPRLIEPHDMLLRPVPDKLAVITYLYQLRAHFTGHELEVAQLGDTTAQSSYTIGRLDASPPTSPPTTQQPNTSSNNNNEDLNNGNASINSHDGASVDATTALYNDRNKRLSGEHAAPDVVDQQTGHTRASRRSSESSQGSQRSSNASVSSAKDRLVASSKSFTSEFFKLGNKVLSPTAAAKEAAKAENRKSTSSVGSNVSDRPQLMTRRQLTDPFASDEEDEDALAGSDATSRDDTLNSNTSASSPAILYQSGSGGNTAATDVAGDTHHSKRISLEDVQVPGLLDLSPISPTLTQHNTRASYNAHHLHGSSRPQHSGATSTDVTSADLVSPSSIPTTFNTPPVTPIAPDHHPKNHSQTAATSSTQSPSSMSPGTLQSPLASAGRSGSPSPTGGATGGVLGGSAAYAELLRDKGSPGHKPRGSSRHEELKERARQLLEAARRDAAAASAQGGGATAGRHQPHSMPRSLSKEEEDRQAALRERARRLIAEAKQGVVSPPSSHPLSPSNTHSIQGSCVVRQSSREGDRVLDNGVILIGSSAGPTTTSPDHRQSPLRIPSSSAPNTSSAFADLKASNSSSSLSNGGGKTRLPSPSDRKKEESGGGGGGSSSCSSTASLGQQGAPSVREVRANRLQSFSSIIDRISPEKDVASKQTPPPQEKAVGSGAAGAEGGSQYLAGEVAALEREQRQIDAQAAKLEKRLRRVMEAGNRQEEEERLMQRWFTLVNKKNALIRRQEQLSILEKESNLERRFELLNRELRAILALEEGQKTEVQQRQEALLLDELVQIVNMRNELVNHLDSQEKMLDDEQRIAHDVSRASVKAQEKCTLM